MSIAGESSPLGRPGGLSLKTGAPQRVTLVVNGVERSVPATMSLLAALRGEMGLTGAKRVVGRARADPAPFLSATKLSAPVSSRSAR